MVTFVPSGTAFGADRAKEQVEVKKAAQNALDALYKE